MIELRSQDAALGPHLQNARDGVGFQHGALSVRGAHHAARLGGQAVQILVALLLVGQAAHQAAAGAGDLGRVQAQALLLGHLDGDRLEVLQKAAAAEHLPADADAAQHFALVPHTDLAQFNAGVEHPGQVLHQLAEVNAAVGDEVEQDLAPVQGVLHVHQLHFQLVACNALLTDLEGALFVLPVLAHPAHIHRVGHAGNAFQLLHHRAVGHLPHALHHLGALGAAGGLHDNVVAGFDVHTGGVKIIGLAALFKADRDDFFHGMVFLSPRFAAFFVIVGTRRLSGWPGQAECPGW